MTSPEGFLGLGGGGCLRGSVGRSEMGARIGRRTWGGGVIGLGMRRCTGEGDGGRGRERNLDGTCRGATLGRERELEIERDLKMTLLRHLKMVKSYGFKIIIK